MPLPDELRPTSKRLLIELVRDAGIDVSDWANFKGGPERASMNPRYCYEWAFVGDNGVTVLNLWYSDLRERNGTVSVTQNARTGFGILQKPVWKVRATRVDDAVRAAAKGLRPVRVIVNDGKRRERGDPEAIASKVHRRDLDPVPWSVTSYDDATGDCVLTRGPLAERLVDQFSDGLALPDTPTEVRSVTGRAYVRSPEVRARALARAGGRCEWCGEPGFALPDGSTFLETHHVVPLSEDGPDTIRNVAAVCPNHHREAHYGANRHRMREELIAYLAGGAAPDRQGVA